MVTRHTYLQTAEITAVAEVQHGVPVKKVKWSPYCSQMFIPPDLLYNAQIRFGDLRSLAAISTINLPDFMA